MGRVNDEWDQEGPRLEFMSLEPDRDVRLKFVGLWFARVGDGRCRARVELERKAGSTTMATSQGPDSDSGRLRAAAQATVNAITRTLHAPRRTFELVDIESTMVFDVPAVTVAVCVRYGQKEERMVGFCMRDEAQPFRAAPFAVLKGTNRFIGAVLMGKIRWGKSAR